MRTKTTTTTTRTTTHEIEGRELLKVMGIALAPGDRARVYVEIPSGGNYSGQQLNLDEHGVTIKIELARETTSETVPSTRRVTTGGRASGADRGCRATRLATSAGPVATRASSTASAPATAYPSAKATATIATRTIGAAVRCSSSVDRGARDLVQSCACT